MTVGVPTIGTYAVRQISDGRWAILALDESRICPGVRCVVVVTPSSHSRGWSPIAQRRGRRQIALRAARPGRVRHRSTAAVAVRA